MISVIIPSYNRAKTIKRAAESVLSQTITDLELIIVDDGSTDNTKEVVESIRDLRLRYIYQENAGACVARNTGIENAKGEIIAFQDSDDAWHADKLERQLVTMEKFGADVCFCSMNKHFYQGKTYIWPEMDKAGIIDRETLLKRPIVSTQTIVAKREAFERYKFDPLVKKAQDYEWSIAASKDFSFCFEPSPLVEQFLQDDSITKKGSKATVETREYILKKYKEETEIFPSFHVQQLRTIVVHKTHLGQDVSKELMTLYRIDHKPKYLIMSLMSKLRLLGLYYKSRGLGDINKI